MNRLSYQRSFAPRAVVNPAWAPFNVDRARAEAAKARELNSIFGLGGPEEANNPVYGGGYRGLLDLINNPGRTDNRMFNMSLTANDRATSARMGTARGQAASGNMQNSGLNAALQAAIASRGQGQRNALYAGESERREGLRRDDTQLLSQFVQQPRLDRYAFDRNLASGAAASSAAKKQSAIAGGAALIGTLAAAFCHVADELYGFASEDAILARYYMAKHAGSDTAEMYSEKNSEELAEKIKNDDGLRAELKDIFDDFVDRAKKDFKRFK